MAKNREKIEPLYKPQRVPKGGLSWEARNKYWNDTPEWIRQIILDYCYGSDTDYRKCTLFYVGKRYALIKFPGGSYWSGGMGNSYCSPWVDRFDYTGEFTRSMQDNHRRTKQVWDCNTKPGRYEFERGIPCGRLTNDVLLKLVADIIALEVQEGLLDD